MTIVVWILLVLLALKLVWNLCVPFVLLSRGAESSNGRKTGISMMPALEVLLLVLATGAAAISSGTSLANRPLFLLGWGAAAIALSYVFLVVVGAVGAWLVGRKKGRSDERASESNRLEFEHVNRELGLSMEPQDWGIVNASGERLTEFCSYLRTRRDLRVETRHQLAELVLASANEALLADPEAALSEVTELIRDDSEAFALELPYWRRLGGEEFPIAARL